jgi:hypothetical protein
MKHFIFLISLALITVRCSQPANDDHKTNTAGSQIARALFITTGISDEESRLAPGIVVAIQSFNKSGTMVRLEARDILYRFEEMKKYNMIILSAFPGYHDADRKYSLSYMSDEELHNLTRFVEEGGVLISGENIGRNYPDGTDRISLFQKLTPENWELSKCYGVTLAERNMTDYSLKGQIKDLVNWEISSRTLSNDDHELWTMVPEKVISDNLLTHGYWIHSGDSALAVTENRFGKGYCYYLALSGLLHPKNEGGFWSEDQISGFYSYVSDHYNKAHGIISELNPWPNGYDYAFCVSLNAEGEPEQYERIFQFLEKEKLQPTVFVNGMVKEEIKTSLLKKSVPLASNGFSYSHYGDIKYPQAVDDILRNENYWNLEFKGFRFPYTHPGFWGLLALDENNYDFESSVGANNLDFFNGSVVPFNLVISNDGFYKSTDILEIAPTYHDDYYFLKIIKEGYFPDSNQITRDAMIFSKYLSNYWNYAVKPYKGVMVFLGHPQFTGYSDVTLTVLENLVEEVKKENTWMATLSDVAVFRKNLALLQFYSEGDANKQHISVTGPDGLWVKDVSFNIPGKIKNARASKGNVKIAESSGFTRLIFDAGDGQTLTINY